MDIQSLKEEVEERKEDLLEFLPETIHPYIQE